MTRLRNCASGSLTESGAEECGAFHMPSRVTSRMPSRKPTHRAAIQTAGLGASLTASLTASLLLLTASANATEVHLDRWPSARAGDPAALQHGARLFVRYCLNCHSARLMRWNKLEEIGFDATQIQSRLIYGNQRIGDMMTIAMHPADATKWFGNAPPDLSTIVRANNTVEHNGTDYVYTLLRSFYRDRSASTGWNNAVFPNIAMPNVFWQLQGPRITTVATVDRVERNEQTGKGASGPRKPGDLTMPWMRIRSVYDAQGNVQTTRTGLTEGPESRSVTFQPLDHARAEAAENDIADIVAFLNWMSEPKKVERIHVGEWAMAYLVVFFLIARWLNKVFWRDVK